MQLGFGLLKAGYEPVVYSDMTAEQIRNSSGRPVTIQFGPSLKLEEELGLRFWQENRYCEVQDVYFSVFSSEGKKLVNVNTNFDKAAQSIDLRMKFGRWLEEFDKRGGEVVIEKCTVDSLERIALDSDLVIVAAGRGKFMELFEKDESKMEFDQAQRQVAMFYADKCDLHRQLDDLPCARQRQVTRYSVIKDVGEVMMAPYLTRCGVEKQYIQFEAIPGAGMDIFSRDGDVGEQYEMAKDWLKQHHPLIHELIEGSTTAPEHEWVFGKIPPTVRKPVAYLPSGKVVFGVADAVIVNDPIIAQGLNAASKWMGLLLKQIIKHGAEPFTPEWMQTCFDEYWEIAQFNNKLTNTALRGPGPVQFKILQAASNNERLAHMFLNCLGEAYKLAPWYWDDSEADRLLEQYGELEMAN